MEKKRKRISFITLGLFVLILILSACGNNDTENASADEEGNSGGDDDTIKIGVLAPTTGGEASGGTDMVNGAKMAVDDINEDGGVLGKDLEMMVEDTACDPEQAVTGANKLVQDGADMIVGGYCSGAALPASGVFDKEDIPFINVASNTEDLLNQGYEGLFIINGLTGDQGVTVADYFNEEGIEDVAIIHDNSDYGKGIAEKAKEAHEEQGGEVVGYEALNPDDKDFGALATKLKSLEPDATYFTGYYNEGGLLRKDFLQKEVPGIFIAGDANAPDPFREIAGVEESEGVLVSQTMSINYIDTPEAESFIEEYEEIYDSKPLIFGHRQYDGMRLAADAMERADTTTDGPAISQAIMDTKDFEAFGETYEFNDDGSRKDAEFMIVEMEEDGEERVY